MKDEIEAAADWWAAQLAGEPKHETGDAALNMAHEEAALRRKKPTAEQVALFREYLIAKLPEQDGFAGVQWNLETPGWCGYVRGCVLSVDYGPSPFLREALLAAGIDPYMALPVKTVMWVNPGSVKARGGYGAAETQIYPKLTGEDVITDFINSTPRRHLLPGA